MRHRHDVDVAEEAAGGALRAALCAAVPLRIVALQQLGEEEFAARFDRERLDGLAQTVAEHGDDVLFRSKKRGETAAVFNAVADGIALLSFCPGGISIFGQTWVATRQGSP